MRRGAHISWSNTTSSSSGREQLVQKTCLPCYHRPPVIRPAGLVLLFLAVPRLARADGPVTDRHYTIDAYRGAAVADYRVIGMGGASLATAFGRIVLPLLKPGLIAGWIYIVIVSVRELASSILLYRPGTEVVAVTIWELWQDGQYVELSALGVMMILVLFCFVMLAELVGRRFGIVEA